MLVTKPPVKTLEEHRALARAAEEAGVLVMVEVHKRFDPVRTPGKPRRAQRAQPPPCSFLPDRGSERPDIAATVRVDNWSFITTTDLSTARIIFSLPDPTCVGFPFSQPDFRTGFFQHSSEEGVLGPARGLPVARGAGPIYVDARDRMQGMGGCGYFSAYMSQPKHQLETFRAWAGKSSDISYYLTQSRPLPPPPCMGMLPHGEGRRRHTQSHRCLPWVKIAVE